MELKAGIPDEARRAYLEALRLQPDLVDGINLGLLYTRTRQLRKAETAADRN